jgi:hypothetical protein
MKGISQILQKGEDLYFFFREVYSYLPKLIFCGIKVTIQMQPVAEKKCIIIIVIKQGALHYKPECRGVDSYRDHRIFFN